jgi:hypothetical protein
MPIYTPGKVTLAKPTGASWLITGSQPIPAVIGEPFGGGYFAGYISHTADGNPTHALIVAPRATGATGGSYTLTTNLQWKTADTTTAGTTSDFDGAANTAAMVTAGIANHPAAQFCKNLSIGGFTDWYLPARYELDIAYFNLKPGNGTNNPAWGSNIYSVPRRDINNTADYPAQTALTAFNTTAEAFVVGDHWMSTQVSALEAWGMTFNNGAQFNYSKTSPIRVRAFRRIAL